MLSKPLLGTDTNKVKISWMEYIFTHLIPTWFQSLNDNFIMWRDLITENYEPYKLLKTDDPFQECYDYFWSSINFDETYPKEFLESLMQMAEDVETGKVKTIPFTKDMLDEVEDLVGDFMDDLKLDEELKDEM
jgi:hypothetical protein